MIKEHTLHDFDTIVTIELTENGYDDTKWYNLSIGSRACTDETFSTLVTYYTVTKKDLRALSEIFLELGDSIV